MRVPPVVHDALDHPQAELDLEDVWLYTFETWGPVQTDHYLDQLHGTLQRLVDTPELGRSCDELRTGYRRHRHEHHVVFYRVRETALEVVRVLHERMDFDTHL